MRAGEKFADSDLLGISYRAVVSEKNLKEGQIEIKVRATGEVSKVAVVEFADKMIHGKK
jgi:prolyl-tRNA synthetase